MISGADGIPGADGAAGLPGKFSNLNYYIEQTKLTKLLLNRYSWFTWSRWC
jgi:hypothetical protein